MRRLAAALALWPALAAAETDEGCAALLSQGAALLGMTVEAEVGAVELPTVLFGEVAGTLPWCEATGIVVTEGEMVGALALGIDRLRWRGLDPLLGGQPPGEVWAEMEGLRVLARTGDPLMDWLLSQQGALEAVDGSLEAGLDAGDGSVRLHALHLGFAGDGAVDLTLDTRGLDLASLPALQASLGRAGVTELSATVAMDGLFERLWMMPLYATVLEGSVDLQADADRFREEAAQQARALPEALFPGPTREALAALALALPHPRGTLRLDVAVVEGAPLGLPRLAGAALTGVPRSAEEVWALLEGVVVTATWAPL